MSDQRSGLSSLSSGGSPLSPTLTLPEALKRQGPSVGVRLQAGTFSLAGTHRVNPYGVQNGNRDEYLILFRPYRNGDPGHDIHHSVGTMNISALGQSNQIVLLVIDVPRPKNLLDEYLGYVMKKDEGGPRVIGCWMPDGGTGRFMFEQDQFFVQMWLTSAKSDVMNLVKLFGMAIVIGVIATLFVCVLWMLVPLIGFAYYKYVQKRRAAGKVTTMDDYRMVMHEWMTELVEAGEFRRVHNEGFALGQNQTERL